ncbi:hypothetical protein IWQ62_005424, partial [Dispira parvispora]
MWVVDVYNALLGLCGLSIFFSLVSVAIILRMWKASPSSKESPSFTLSLWIALSDIPLRVSDMLSNPMTWNGTVGPTSSVYLRFSVWLTYFSSFWFLYLNVMIALDLQLVFFHRLPRQARVRRFYPWIGFALAFVLAFWYLILPAPRYVNGNMISFGEKYSTANRFNLVWTMLWFLVGIVYTVGVVAAVWIKIYISRRRLKHLETQYRHSDNLSSSVIRNALIIIAYPVLMAIVFIPFVLASGFQSLIPGKPFTLYWSIATNFLYSSQGLFSFAILLFHPVMLAYYRRKDSHTFFLWSWLSRVLGTLTA